MSADRLCARLGQALALPELPVSALGSSEGGDAGAQVGALAIEPLPSVGVALPVDLGDALQRRVSAARITVGVRVRVQGTSALARRELERLVSRLWWRLENPELVEATAFPRDPAEGYAVRALRPVRAAFGELPEGGAWRAELTAAVDALLWPIDLEGEAGRKIDHLLVRVAGTGVAFDPGRVRVRAGEEAAVTLTLDLRAFVWSDPAAVPPAPEAPPARLHLVLVGPDEGPALGTLVHALVPVEGGIASARYRAGAVPGTDRLVVHLPGTDGDRGPVLGTLEIEVGP